MDDALRRRLDALTLVGVAALAALLSLGVSLAGTEFLSWFAVAFLLVGGFLAVVVSE